MGGTNVEILSDYNHGSNPTITGYVDLMNDRYRSLKKIIQKNDTRLGSPVSVSRINQRSMEKAAAIVMVRDKHRTSNGDRFLLTAEDESDDIKVLVDEDVGEKIVEDDVIGVRGQVGRDIIFANYVTRPDIPVQDKDDLAFTDDDATAAFISDLHFGSIDFIHRVATNFIQWMHEHRPDYLLVAGDVVEGVGIYPGQQEELEVDDIHEQFRLFRDFIKSLPDDTEIIVSTGNHDPVRLAEPQPPIPDRYRGSLRSKGNLTFVPNPCRVRLHGKHTVLMYHGMSFDEHVNKLQHLRDSAYRNPELCMVDWLQRRHLVPSYGDVGLVPQKEDVLAIKDVPDTLHMGHTHSFAAATYKGVNMICSSTFQGQTSFQERVGHKPDPGKVATMDLKTRTMEVHNLQ